VDEEFDTEEEMIRDFNQIGVLANKYEFIAAAIPLLEDYRKIKAGKLQAAMEKAQRKQYACLGFTMPPQTPPL
jgi:hypothetical protein